MVALAVIVTAGVAFRYTGNALVWYDEVASILLAWVTYYGAALAALKRANIGVPEIVRMFPPNARVALAIFAEICVFGFFILLAWVGYTVLEILASDRLVSLPAVSVAWAQSVIPIGSVLFIIAEALALPRILHDARQP
ncbi:MAG: TRAP transporter small permease subunit [Burkholderiaceae bacterium]|nr:TRAP transporter small permease subunit [Burkholderiaceae bacterium]